jgi:hypothetical protein
MGAKSEAIEVFCVVDPRRISTHSNRVEWKGS